MTLPKTIKNQATQKAHEEPPAETEPCRADQILKQTLERLAARTGSSSVGGAAGDAVTRLDSASVSADEFVSISFQLVMSKCLFKQNLCENLAAAKALKKKKKKHPWWGEKTKAFPALHTETVRLLPFHFFYLFFSFYNV